MSNYGCGAMYNHSYNQFYTPQPPPPPPPPPHPTHTHRGLNEDRLQSLGVFDANHRRSILHKAQAVSDTVDLENMLTDLSSVIADLEAFTVVSHVMIMCSLWGVRRECLLLATTCGHGMPTLVITSGMCIVL